MTVPFAHLHLHTPEGSLLDGFCRIDPMIKLAKEFGMDSIGVSDHGTCFAHIQFYQKCKKAGLHPVLGMEGYIAPKKQWKKADFETINYTDVAYRTKDELAALKSEGYVAFEKKKKDSFTKNKPTKPEHEEFLQKFKEANPEYFESLKKSHRWYLSGKQDDKQKRLFEWSPRIAHLLMIAKNNEGYKNLIKLTSIGSLEGFYGKPRIDYHDIKKYGKGIIATSSCLGGTIPQLIRKGKMRVAKNHIKFYQRCFDEFYLEIQPSTMEEQQLVNSVLIQWSEELGIPLVATSDAHMLRPEDRPVHKAITSINKGKDDDESDIDVYEHCVFYSAQEMLDMGMPEQALINAYNIAHSCHVDLDDTTIKYPEFTVPEGYNFDTYLSHLANKGLVEKLAEGNFIGENAYQVFETYKKRLDYELEVIAKKGISAYMLIVWDYIDFAKRNGILVGPGRGSAAGSLVAYVLGITNLDPILYNLLFYRFINPERPGFPDVDTDFDYLRRHEVIEYVTNKYGWDKVAQIATFGTLSTKSALKDIGRALNIDHNEINELNKHIPSHQGKVMPISEALDEIKQVKAYAERYPRLFELALEVESMPRTQGVHACFDKDTLVTTDKGFKPIRDIQVGDKVLTHEKRFKEVGAVMVNPSNNIYKVHANGVIPFEVTGNHPIYTRKSKRVNGKRDGVSTSWKEYDTPSWSKVEDLTTTEYVGIPVNQESKLPSSNIGLPFHNKNFWWLIGRYLGDGWIESPERNDERYQAKGWKDRRIIICCNKNTDDEKDAILKRLEGMFDYRVETARTTYKIYISNKLLHIYLEQFGRLAHGKKLTGDIINLPNDLLKEFLDGYLSADGYFNEKYQKYNFKTVSKQLAHGIIACVHKVYNIHCSISVIPAKVEVIEGRTVNSKEKYDVNFRCQPTSKAQSFYEDGYIWSRIKKIVKEDIQKDMYNLTVYDDSSYVVNHVAAHNCGVLITPEPITEEVALIKGKKAGERVVAYDGPTLEQKGFIKFDFLGLKNLSVIEICRRLVEKRHGYLIDVDNLIPEDINTFEMIRRGETDSLFQIESDGMKKMFNGMNQVNFETLIAGVALYRPGPMDYIPKYTALANGHEEIPEVHPVFDKITKNTFGIMIYQEQVMEVAVEMAGYSMGEADVLRKAVGNLIAV
ncbi:DNA polymerase III subunit alpha [Priestia megaterium]